MTQTRFSAPLQIYLFLRSEITSLTALFAILAGIILNKSFSGVINEVSTEKPIRHLLGLGQ